MSHEDNRRERSERAALCEIAVQLEELNEKFDRVAEALESLLEKVNGNKST